MKPTFLLASCLVPALMITTAGAEDDRPGPPPPGPLLRILDADGDHEISGAEISNAAAVLSELDTNKDGSLTREELHPPRGDKEPRPDQRPQRGGGDEQGRLPHPPPPIIAALDQDRDGVLSAEELENSADALAKLDRNGDGELTPRELHPGPPPEGKGEEGQRRRPRGDEGERSASPQRPGRGRSPKAP